MRLSDFGLLISLSHDVGESGAGDGPHELLRPSRPLLGGFFYHAFAMLPPVEHRPVDLVEGGALIRPTCRLSWAFPCTDRPTDD